MAFQNQELYYKLCFWPDKVWHNKEWYRLLTGGFVHANFQHLFFNMISFFSFGPFVESCFAVEFGSMGPTAFILFYVLAEVICNLPDLNHNKDNYYFHSVGASGAVSAVIFAAILYEPRLLFYGFIPAYLFGVLYLAYCVYAAQQQRDNIGHTAHFSGAIFGMIFPLVFEPTLFMECIHKIIGQ
jgi:membrane associated rhomboid family serine protease